MIYLIELISSYGVALVFCWVLLEQIGLPIPAYPILMVAGSVASVGSLSLPALAAAAIVACLIADAVWFFGGKHYGAAILRLVCQLSLTPDSCVIQSKSAFDRWGVRFLIVAKFVPGFGFMAIAMAGLVGVRKRSFFLYDLLGTTLWVGSGVGFGYVFSPAVERVLVALAQTGDVGLLLVIAAVATYIGRRAWMRYRSRTRPAIERK